MDTNAFSSIAVIKLPASCRIIASACCPDKDLVVLISRLGGKDRLSLWKVQGSKKWEVDVGTDEATSEEIVDISWSPGGDSIAIAHDPPRITVHSVQDGAQERVLPPKFMQSGQTGQPRLYAMWWFAANPKVSSGNIPDIFKRKNVIAGSSHAILKTLPLLDHIQDEASKTTATDLFAFQGSQTRVSPKSAMPESIRTWPTLLPDAMSASISPTASRSKLPQRATEVLDEADDSIANSLLVVADGRGQLHYFLDGSYPLGSISLGSGMTIASLVKDPKSHNFLAHRRHGGLTDLVPILIRIPYLDQRHGRDMAQLSSTARALTWYTTRVVREMREVWFGSETNEGGRDCGPQWVRDLASRQSDQFGQYEPQPIMDLTSLLVTGKASESLADFMGSAPQMSERGTQKWESVVTEALVKLRDYSDKRVAPACQRLHLVLEELLGWSQLPQFARFDLPKHEIATCLDLTARAIVIASGLTAVARRELTRFKEFMTWLRWETALSSPANEVPPPMKHDILEVNNYFQSGLVVSSIDKWFMGPVPQFSPDVLTGNESNPTLASAIFKAQTVLGNPARMAWESASITNITLWVQMFTASIQMVNPRDLSHLDRNLDALVQDLSTRCERVFARACGATTRCATVSAKSDSIKDASSSPNPMSEDIAKRMVRERIVRDEETGQSSQFLAFYMPSREGSFLCVARMLHGSTPGKIEVAVLICQLTEEDETTRFDVEQVEFFDDEGMLVIYRTRDEGPLFLANMGYRDLSYEELIAAEFSRESSREELFNIIVKQSSENQLSSELVPIKRCRELVASGGGPTLAVNGRAGRRIACILDSNGLTLEALDMEGDAEDDMDEDD